MLKRFAFLVAAGVAVAALGYSQQSIVGLSVGATSPDNGKAMFTSYCAPCHGVDGKGNGPVASTLIQKPTDLTVLAMNNGGNFPSRHLIGVIKFGPEVPAAHGTKDMPIWGPFLATVDHQRIAADLQTLRISNLEAYVESIQGNQSTATPREVQGN